jgi:hypothetical protein
LSVPIDRQAGLVTQLFKLIGIAEDPGPDGPIRTAIISGHSEVFLVAEGDPVAFTYRVAKISGEAVELVHQGDGSVVRLALK